MSVEIDRLRERYHVMYGLSQGLNVATILAGLLSWGQAPARVAFGLVAASWAMMWAWRRWGWLPLKAAMEADTAKALAEFEAQMARFR